MLFRSLQLAEVIGTDSHIAAQVGTNYTWIKMGEPSLGALKLALHDNEDGIIRKDFGTIDPNTISNRYFIKSLSVTSRPLKTGFRKKGQKIWAGHFTDSENDFKNMRQKDKWVYLPLVDHSFEVHARCS